MYISQRRFILGLRFNFPVTVTITKDSLRNFLRGSIDLLKINIY